MVSLLTKPAKIDADLGGLVYSLTPRIKDSAAVPWVARPVALGILVLALQSGDAGHSGDLPDL